MKRSRYSVEFKKEAFSLLIMEGMTALESSQKLGISAGMLYRWKAVYLEEWGGDGEAGQGASPAQMDEEIQRLKKALGREERITEILKKTVGYFSKDEL